MKLGVLTVPFSKESLDGALDIVKRTGVNVVEIGTGKMWWA